MILAKDHCENARMQRSSPIISGGSAASMGIRMTACGEWSLHRFVYRFAKPHGNVDQILTDRARARERFL